MGNIIVGGNNMNEAQKEFFETLSSIQDNAVYQALGEYEETDSLTDLLYNATYEALTSILISRNNYTQVEAKRGLNH